MSEIADDTTGAADDMVAAQVEIHGCPVSDSRGQVVVQVPGRIDRPAHLAHELHGHAKAATQVAAGDLDQFLER